MREIKFRAWSEERKLMIKPEMLSPRFLSLNGKRMYIESERMACFGGGYNLKKESFTDLMQYAGTKNGIELYEGDVIRDHIGIGVISWSESNFAFKVRYTGEYLSLGKWFADYLESEESSIELIGNIHKNPELLEKNND